MTNTRRYPWPDEEEEKAQLKKFRVYMQWTNPDSGTFDVEAEDEDEATDMVIDDHENEIGEDYQVNKVVCLGDVTTTPELYVDPNQLNMDGV